MDPKKLFYFEIECIVTWQHGDANSLITLKWQKNVNFDFEKFHPDVAFGVSKNSGKFQFKVDVCELEVSASGFQKRSARAYLM